MDVIIVDNLVNAKTEATKRIGEITGRTPVFYELDLRDAEKLSCDVAACYADSKKSAEVLHWTAEHSPVDMCRDSFRWQKKTPWVTVRETTPKA